jgi:hypothetical protein
MVVRWKNKDGTSGVLTRPYTWQERMWLRDFSTWDHGGPYIRVGPRSVAPAVAATSRQTEATTRSAAEAAADQAQPNLPPEKD